MRLSDLAGGVPGAVVGGGADYDVQRVVQDSRRPVAVATIGFAEDWRGPTPSAVAARLKGGDPPVYVGSTPDESGTQVLLSTQRLNRVRGIDRDNVTVTVEAGCILQALQEH